RAGGGLHATDGHGGTEPDDNLCRSDVDVTGGRDARRLGRLGSLPLPVELSGFGAEDEHVPFMWGEDQGWALVLLLGVADGYPAVGEIGDLDASVVAAVGALAPRDVDQVRCGHRCSYSCCLSWFWWMMPAIMLMDRSGSSARARTWSKISL